MERFTNEFVKKRYSVTKRALLISLVITLIGLFMIGYGIFINSNYETDYIYFDDVLVSEGEHEDIGAYLDIHFEPFQFAEDEEGTNKYYIAWDKDYAYIIYMDSLRLGEFTSEDLYDKPVRVEGVTTVMPDNIRQWALEGYNYYFSEDETFTPITDKDFESYLGDVYLDTTVSPEEPGDMYWVIGMLPAFFGGIFLIAAIVGLVNFKKNTKKLTDSEALKLDMELNSPNSKFYKKAALFLTDSRIVVLDNTFNIINFEDIIWIYPYELRQNGIKTTQAIKVMNKEGKVYTIANVAAFGKKDKIEYNEIYQTILSKNSNIVSGYDLQTRKLIKEKYGFKA